MEHNTCQQMRAKRSNVLALQMIGTGAILDVSVGMKSVTCEVYEFSAGQSTDPAEVGVGKLLVDAEKFPVHVLVVDDEPLIRWSVAESLADLGMDVEQAPDAASALRAVTTAAAPFQAVVLDLRLPDMKDLALLATLRQLLPDARLVLMTAFGTPDTFTGAALLGAAVLNKPFELAELKRLVLGPGR
jgi:CheY-like chemotaxis protein